MAARAQTAPVRLAKTQRQHLVAKLLGSHAVTSQEQVVHLLAETGVARLDGKMIDLAHKRVAERLLLRAEAMAAT